MALTRWFLRQIFRAGTSSWRSKKSARRHLTRPLSFAADWQLEERCLLSAAPLTMPQATTSDLSTLFFVGNTTINGQHFGPVPDKLLTFTNNGPQTVFPYFRNPNTGQPKGLNSFWDPMDPHGHEFRGYIGYRTNNTNFAGLLPKQTITVKVPLVFWDSGRVEIAADGSDLFDQNGAQNPFRYDVNAALSITDPNLQQFTADYAGGIVMWYHSPTALDASNDAPVQLTEYTIRDAYLGTLPNPDPLPTGELHSLINYDVSYVDSMVLSIAMEATNVPIPIPPFDPNIGPVGGPTKDFAWIGSQLTFTQMQAGIKQFTTSTADGGILGNYFGGQGYPYYNNPNPDAPIKVPSGQNLVFQSPLAGTKSTYNTFGPINQWMLSSGGTGLIGEIVGGTSLGQTDNNTLQLNHMTPTDRANLQRLHDELATGTVFGVTASTAPLASDIQPGTTLESVNPDTGIATLSHPTIVANQGLHTYTFQRPITDYALTRLVNLWYSWAQYYVNNVNVSAVANRPGSLTSDLRVLTIPASDLVVGMSISGPNIRPGTTVLSIASDKSSVNLSQLALGSGAGTFSFGVPTLSAIPGTDQASMFVITTQGPGNDPQTALLFSQAVYEVMNVMGTIPKKTSLPTAFEVLGNSIGGNVGFLPVQDDTINGEIRDLIKSILRGVYDFRQFDEKDWYPDPTHAVGGQNFNVYNLDPFVWFVHKVLNLSGYGFSLDDDVADVEANYATSLAFSISGLGEGGVNPLKNTDEWANGAPFGTVSDQAKILIVNTPSGDQYLIQLTDKTVYWQVYPPSDLGPGALVSGQGIQPGTRIKAYGPLDELIFELDTKPLQTGTFHLTFSGQPLAVLAGPASGVRGQPRSFFVATDLFSTVDPAAQFTHTVNWGDGSSQTVRSLSSLTLDHAFAAAGTYTVQLTTRDEDGNVGEPISRTITIVDAETQPDPVDPTKNAFVVGGSARRDAIQVRTGTRKALQVSINGKLHRPSGVSRVIAYGQAGNDTFSAASSPVPVMFFGDGGNDTLIGSAFGDLLAGGDGADQVFGRGGHDVQFGGMGRDVLHGDKGDDLLLGAVTAHDRNLAALGNIVREWSASRPRETKRANLTDGSGSQNRQNGDTFLSATTLIDDSVIDLVFGDSRDWLLPFSEGRTLRHSH
jgi:hypothetical protein